MAIYKSILLTVTLLLATNITASKKDRSTVIETPVECMNPGFCSIKPKGYDKLEEKINSVLPPFLVKDYSDRFGEENRMQPPKLSPQTDWDNCPYEMKTEQMYTFNYGQNNSDTAIIVQTERFKQFLDTVSCAVQHITTDSKAQCFRELGVGREDGEFDMKSSCQTITSKRTLYVYNELKNQVIQQEFNVSVCCACIVYI